MNPIWLLKAGVLFKKYWGKILAVGFTVVWIIFTVSLYNINQNLHEELGASGAAIDVCIANRDNMSNTLDRLKKQIAIIQADNEQYKTEIAAAEVRIEDLEFALSLEIVDVDAAIIPESCEGSIGWMLERALQ